MRETICYALLTEYERELPALFIVSQVSLANGAHGQLSVRVERADGVKCERCWKYRTDVGSATRICRPSAPECAPP
jgi:isoleucyl-tRNA synthetase